MIGHVYDVTRQPSPMSINCRQIC